MNESETLTGEPLPGAKALVSTSDSLRAYFNAALENVRRSIPELAGRLKTAGVVRLCVLYDGCGDSGQIEEVSYFDASGTAIDPTAHTGFTDDGLRELFYDLTQARHPGWENNDGAFGEFRWNLSTEELEHIHNDRFTDYDTTEHQGL
jgi:hypothetical protein